MLSARTPQGRLAALILFAGVLVTACGGSSASASLAPTEAPSAAPTRSAPSSTPSQESPATEDVHPIAEALVTQLSSDMLVTHLEQTASFSTTGTTATDGVATMTADLSGDDLSLHLTLEADGVTALDQEMVVVGDTVYVREPGGEWQSAPATAVGPSIAEIFKAIRFVDDPSVLQYIGLEQVDGRTLHHLTGTEIPYQPAAGGTGEYDAFDIWVEEDGTPVSVASTFSARDGAGNEVTGSTDLDFSNWGGSITIEAPTVE